MNMRLLLFVLLVSVVHSDAQSYTIITNAFFPAYTNASDAGYLKEYLQAGQTLNTWTNLFAVRCFRDLDSPKNYIDDMAIDYQRKYPGMKFAMFNEKSKNRYFIDFLAYPLDKKSKYFEWDFFRAQTNTTGGIVVFQYAERRYRKKSIHEFDTWDIKGLRRHMLPLLMTNEFTIQ
jgi:hypothetical protein